MNPIHERIKHFIVMDILSGEDSGSIQEHTDLREAGVLDSLSTLKLVSLLEKQYGVEFEASDLDGDHFSSVANIEHLVVSKLRLVRRTL